MSIDPVASPLYQRWLAVLAARRSSRAILAPDGGAGATFGELAEALADEPQAQAPLAVEADGAAFLVQALRAWRDRQPLLALEPGTAPVPVPLEGLPPETAHVKQTSGSTGEPRAVLFSAEQLLADGDQIVATMGLGRYGANVAAISLAHSYGFSNLVLPLLTHGIPMVLAGSPLPGAVDSALDAAGGDAVVPAVPAMWQAWFEAGIVDRRRIGLAISAGAPLPASLETAVFEATGVKIHNFLGSSECGGIAFDRSGRPRGDGRLAGVAMEGLTLEVSPAGTLAVSGAPVGTGYWPDGETETLGAGRFVTGDLAEIAPDGGVRLLGRAGDEINVAGRKASPAEIESVLAAVEGVSCCVVFGVPSRDRGRNEEIVACFNGTAGEAELKRAASAALPSWKVPRQWWPCTQLEVDRRGKIARRRWRDRYLQATGARPAG